MSAWEREAVYAAEERVLECIDDADLTIELGDVAAWCSDVAYAAGWADSTPDFRGFVPPVYRVEFDLPNDNPELDEAAGWVDREGTIHLDPRIVDRWKVVHELAHAIDYRDGHSEGFQDRLVELVEVAFGSDIADQLRDALALELGAALALELGDAALRLEASGR